MAHRRRRPATRSRTPSSPPTASRCPVAGRTGRPGPLAGGPSRPAFRAHQRAPTGRQPDGAVGRRAAQGAVARAFEQPDGGGQPGQPDHRLPAPGRAVHRARRRDPQRLLHHRRTRCRTSSTSSCIGGVLSSVMIPLLVRAQNEDRDGGEAYTRRLLTLAGVGAAGRDRRRRCSPRRCSPGSTSAARPPARPIPQLATVLAYLLLPQIFFYGMGALLGAILNSRGAVRRRSPGPRCSTTSSSSGSSGFCRRSRRPGTIATRAARAGPRHHARDRRAGRGADPGGAPGRVPLPPGAGAGTPG